MRSGEWLLGGRFLSEWAGCAVSLTLPRQDFCVVGGRERVSSQLDSVEIRPGRVRDDRRDEEYCLFG